MRKIAIILTFILGSFIHPAYATAPQVPPQIPNEDAKNVGRKVWMENVQNNLPKMLCKTDQYFMTCFTVTEKDCVGMNELFVQACLNNVALALPTELSSDEAKHWGAVIGRCTLDLYEKFMNTKKLNKPECNEVKKDAKEQPKKEPKS